VRLLHRLGYTNVSDFPGGLAEWQEAHPPARVHAAPVTPAAHAPEPLASRSLLVDAFERYSTRALVGFWFGTIGTCAVIYWLLSIATMGGLQGTGGHVGHDVGGLFTALYFSFVTATSVGFGDIVPLGAARAVAIAEAVVGLLVFGAVVSKLVSRRQEEVVGEIHRIAFEDRLGRVQTSLHLVLAEIQAVERLCREHDGAVDAVLARLDSLSGICFAELRTIHDLLFRPQSAPDEHVLEGILASLSIVLRQLRDLLRCLNARSPYLARNLSGVARIANDICADCVPRRYAPSLREWMDAIREVASEIS
jgi:potassium channel LctB